MKKEDKEHDEKKKRESRRWAPRGGGEGKSINKRRSPATQLAVLLSLVVLLARLLRSPLPPS